MKVLFIHTFDYYEPLGIMVLSAFLKKNGHECQLLDLKFDKNYIKKALEIKPDIIAYSITTNNWKRYHKINLELKKNLFFFSIFGGPHCTFFPEFINEDGVDAICRGEGEDALLELTQALEQKNDFSKIQNLWIKKDGSVFKNDIRPLIQDLDTLPFPDRQLINKYKKYSKRSRVRTITSRGCPYNCTYCFNHSYKELYSEKGKYVRQRSPENVIEELKQLKSLYNPVNFEFHDDIFILNKTWLENFVYLYISEKIQIPFEINVRVDLVTSEVAELLKKAGCYSVQFGIESGNEKIRNEILQRNISDEMILKAASIFKFNKIKVNTFNLVGIPSENITDTIATMILNSKCRVTYAMNSIYQPYPGTKLAEYAIKMNYYDGRVDNFDKNYLYGKSIINSKDIKKIERLHYLFAFGVKYPFLIPIIKILLKLPLNKIYQSWYFIYRVYNVIFVFKRLRIREIL
jgi:anaerobic magnesium-protoporphyrin IX monomethyl ester cyclase